MKNGYIPKDQRKTILFLADDMRMPSGIGTMTREIILGTSHIFNYVHIGAGINHPDYGKIFDMSQEVDKEVGTTLQILDIGFGYIKCQLSCVNKCQYSIIIFGTTYQHHITTSLSMSLAIY
jgi:hypothetical protein